MTSTAVAAPGDVLSEKIEWSKALAVANLLPRQYQGNPGNLLLAAEYADALGVSRINAITSIHVIEGKPSASADLIGALVRRAGHKLRVTGDDQHAAAQIIRCDDTDYTYEARWDLARARQAGLLSKDVWKRYPAAMLRARAVTEAARMAAADALLGLVYTPEELGADVDATGSPVRVRSETTVTDPQSGADRMRAMLGPSETTIVPDEHVTHTSALVTRPQLTKLHVLLTECQIGDRDACLQWLTDETGRTVASSKDLTKDEASACIESLQRLAALDTMPPPGVDADTGEITDAEVVEGDDA